MSLSLALVAALTVRWSRDPRTLADLAKGPLARLAWTASSPEALDGHVQSRPAGRSRRCCWTSWRSWTQRITHRMEVQAIAALAQVTESWAGPDAAGQTRPGCGTGPDSPALAAAYRLAVDPRRSARGWPIEIFVRARRGHQGRCSPRQAHLVSWAGLCRSVQPVRMTRRTRACRRSARSQLRPRRLPRRVLPRSAPPASSSSFLANGSPASCRRTRGPGPRPARRRPSPSGSCAAGAVGLTAGVDRGRPLTATSSPRAALARRSAVGSGQIRMPRSDADVVQLGVSRRAQFADDEHAA